ETYTAWQKKLCSMIIIILGMKKKFTITQFPIKLLHGQSLVVFAFVRHEKSVNYFLAMPLLSSIFLKTFQRKACLKLTTSAAPSKITLKKPRTVSFSINLIVQDF